MRAPRLPKRLCLLAVSILILYVLWRRTGWREIAAVCSGLDGAWFAAALALFVPQTLLSGLRWAWIAGCYQRIGAWRATETVLASSALNVILPSKMGDVAKGVWLDRSRPGGDVSTGLGLGLFEKGLDTAALGLLMLCATAASPPTELLGWALTGSTAAGVAAFLLILTRPAASVLAGWANTKRSGITGHALRLAGGAGGVIIRLRGRPARLALILGSAVLLWCLHLAQFSLALRAARGSVEESFLWSRVPMAIFVGLLPVSLAGIGTRDAAMVYLLSPRLDPATGAALGAFATLRYVLVALAGLPFIPRLPKN